jgi:hypothetical protein
MPTRRTDAGAESPVWTPADAVTDQEMAFGGDAAAASTPQDAAVARPRRSGAVTTLLAVIALGATAGMAFAAGRATVPETTTTGGNAGPGGDAVGQIAPDASFAPDRVPLGDRDGLGYRGGIDGISGTVTAVGADSITLRLADGQTVTISTTSTTTYHLSSAAASSDVAAGDTVVVSVPGGGRGNGGLDAGSQAATDVTVTSE